MHKAKRLVIRKSKDKTYGGFFPQWYWIWQGRTIRTNSNLFTHLPMLALCNSDAQDPCLLSWDRCPQISPGPHFSTTSRCISTTSLAHGLLLANIPSLCEPHWFRRENQPLFFPNKINRRMKTQPCAFAELRLKEGSITGASTKGRRASHSPCMHHRALLAGDLWVCLYFPPSIFFTFLFSSFSYTSK